MFKAIYEKHNVPQADRPKLTRYFNHQNGIPAELRHYFITKEWAGLYRDCLRALTNRFITRLSQMAQHSEGQPTCKN